MARNFIRMFCVNNVNMAQVPTTNSTARQRVQKSRNNLLFGVHLFMLGSFVSLVGYLGMMCHHMLH
ncbi:hypothetical protein NTE_01986 [Candidatus Nitrososphaera evergladensis SR1]|uniref:Uncharacterized protein n=2 Tax=Nitrososphaera TaxID=497726 RepID=A0A075MXL7_9ARCH|nr:hypothetical protein NTE_01986 [Candidatus Nitrososphaera evergladensis SR1]